MDNRELQEQIAQLNKTALQFANRCGKFFFYTESSIYDLEQILQGYHEDLRSEKPTENQLWSMASIWGAYLGETMLRNGLRDKGFEWAVADGSPIPVLRNGPKYPEKLHRLFAHKLFFFFVYHQRRRKNICFYIHMLRIALTDQS